MAAEPVTPPRRAGARLLLASLAAVALLALTGCAGSGADRTVRGIPDE